LAGVKYREWAEFKKTKADGKKESTKEVNAVSLDPSRGTRCPIA